MHPDLKRFIDDAWNDHADDEAGVALRLHQGIARVDDEEGLVELARLVQHVHGEHLGRWDDALQLLAALARLPAFDAHGDSGRQLRLMRSGIALAAGVSDTRGTLPSGDRITVTARAAMLLAGHDAARAATLLDEAIGAWETASPSALDGSTRALATAGNNIASTLQHKASRTEAERALMLHAAEAGRRFWALAGTWLETERAEYRLAMVWLAAGDAARARAHGQACLAIIEAQPGSHPLERFFAHEALALAARELGDRDLAADSVAEAAQAFAAIDEADQGACRATLARLQMPGAA